jgi:hypothetical protein
MLGWTSLWRTWQIGSHHRAEPIELEEAAASCAGCLVRAERAIRPPGQELGAADLERFGIEIETDARADIITHVASTRRSLPGDRRPTTRKFNRRLEITLV